MKPRRYVALKREHATLRLWKAAPEAVRYLSAVAAGKEQFNEGRFKAAREILLRTLPTISSQEVKSDSTSISASMTIDPEVRDLARDLLKEVIAAQEGVAE